MSTPRPFRFAVQAFDAPSGAAWRETARSAEALGYSALFTTDHHFGPGQIVDISGHRPVDVAPIAAMTMAAAVTTTLKVGCRVFCVDYHHPVILAKELATVDFLTEGRLEAAIGAGWVAAEYDGLGIQLDRPGIRIARLAEAVAILRAHWTGEPVDFHGEHFSAFGFAGRPVPVQTHIPLMIGGGSPRVLGLAGQLADIVSLNFNNAAGKLGSSSVASSSAAVTAEKIEWIKAGAGDRFEQLEIEVGGYFVSVTDTPAAASEAIGGRFGVAGDEIAASPHALIGSIDSICDDLHARREQYGISYYTIAQRNMAEFAPVVARLAGR